MIILAINTASSRTGIALFDGKNSGNLKLLAEKSWPAKNNEAEKLMPAIDYLFKKSKKKFKDLKEIYVIKGPGSFTGLRVGVTVANTMAHLTGATLFGLNTFEFWHSQTDLPILVYAGSGGVYLSENSDAKPELINLPELNAILNSLKIKEFAGDISPAQISTLKKIKFKKVKTNFGAAMKNIIKKNLEDKILKNVKLVQPIYIKDPGITPSKKQFILK